MIIANLPENYAIKMTKNTIIHAPWGDYVIVQEGKENILAKVRSNVNKQLILGKDQKLMTVKDGALVTTFTHKVTGEVITPAVYDSRLIEKMNKELYESYQLEEEDQDEADKLKIRLLALEMEKEYTKSSVREPATLIPYVPTVVIETTLPEHDYNPYVICTLLSGTYHAAGCYSFNYVEFAKHLMERESKKYGVTLSINNSDIQFAKVNGSYLNLWNVDDSRLGRYLRETHAEIITLMEDVERMITSKFFALYSKKPVTENERADIHTSLLNLESAMTKVDVKVSSKIGKSHILARIREMISKLEANK